jgi:CDP-glucose 4,6-dehydratase
MKKINILITGNQGFIGCWVSLLLIKNRINVIGVDDRSSLGSRLFDKLKLKNKIKAQYKININNLQKIKSIIEQHKIDVIINLAGQAIVPRAFAEPVKTYSDNALGTLSLLNISDNSKTVKSFITITSDKVYDNLNEGKPFKESDPLGGKDIYSISKSASENIVSTYIKSHQVNKNLNIQTVRLGNVVGGGDFSINRLLPDLFYATKFKKEFMCRYSKATRPFQHVTDVANGIVKIMIASFENKIKSGESWNLGPKNNSHMIVEGVLNEFMKKFPNIKIIHKTNNLPEDILLSVSVDKYSKKFGMPNMTSNESVIAAINWYHSLLNGKPLKDLMNSDVNKLIQL